MSLEDQMFKNAEDVVQGDAVMIFNEVGGQYHRYTVSAVVHNDDRKTTTLWLHQYGDRTFGNKHHLMLG